MTSAVAGWLPVRLAAMGEPQPAASPATARPPDRRRKSRRDGAPGTCGSSREVHVNRVTGDCGTVIATMQHVGPDGAGAGTPSEGKDVEGDDAGRRVPAAVDVPGAVVELGRDVGVRLRRRRPGVGGALVRPAGRLPGSHRGAV